MLAMANRLFTGTTSLLVCMLFTHAGAEEFNFEIGLAYEGEQLDRTTAALVGGGIPDPSISLNESSLDTDGFNVFGTWYFKSLSDATGPRSRADFLSRASGLSLSYQRRNDDRASVFTSASPALPSGATQSSAKTDTLAASVRYVFSGNNWYGIGRASRDKFELNGTTSSNVTFSGGSNFETYSIGVGRYFGASTAIDLSYLRNEFENDAAVATFTHIGSLGTSWQYGADLGMALSVEQGGTDTYSAAFSLYPTRNFEFGLGYSLDSRDGPFDQSSVRGFVSWFFRNDMSLVGYYKQNQDDSPAVIDLSQYSYGVGIIARF
jgi:hypothetical protein